MIRVLQINTNRSKTSVELAKQHAKQNNIDIVAITEPNNSSINQQYITDNAQTAALLFVKTGTATETGRGAHFVWAEVGEQRIYSVYLSPVTPVRPEIEKTHF